MHEELKQLSRIMDFYSTWMIVIFLLGYVFITLEHVIRIDKATIALLMGIGCWVLQFSYKPDMCDVSLTCLGEHISSISQIVFFLMGALIIVEIINVHKGFALIANSLYVTSKRQLLWIIGILAFVLSAILDNLTTTIVMVTLLSKLLNSGRDRLLFGGAVVIAANAGGAWTPIGDVTTTMLWIGGQITSWATMRDLFLPSLGCLIVALLVISTMVKGHFEPIADYQKENKLEPLGEVVFFLGIAALIFVPIFKTWTGLPPFMGMLFGLSILWLVTDIVHRQYKDRDYLRLPSVMTKIDFSGLLFFLGILLAIDAMDAAGILKQLAGWLDGHFSSHVVIATLIGLISAIIDNVPLVAGSMGMYSLQQYAPDHHLWQLIAYCAGTGGSILIIGSAAGIVYMGLEKVNFFWYLKHISLPALLGYLAGIGIYTILGSN